MASEEIDLSLSLGCGDGSSKKTLTPPFSSPPIEPVQTNLLLMTKPIHVANPNLNPSFPSSSNNNIDPFLVSSSDDNNLPSVAAKVKGNVSTGASSTRRSRRASSNRRNRAEDETIPPPFPWATNKQATIHNQRYLLENNIYTITGTLHCKKCEQEFQLSLDLVEKAHDLRKFIYRKKDRMHDRAPAAWVNPVFPKCPLCGRENSTRPVLAKDKKEINWLFLLLSQMLGCCTLDHLKYFCMHNSNHRTGAKDRLLYLTYMELAKQLEPEWFDS
ncbi:unnamed protein product [Sphenostylis stenocarpa]|uniref:DUF7086 domain-containing protein n=1 Tax=Sphenostylis stenocarpa TaxID=92480 RepID=A0AA86SW76_9FABA|nr:unnamed protein product [Sphenostylis stenocarpa]